MSSFPFQLEPMVGERRDCNMFLGIYSRDVELGGAKFAKDFWR